ncbi:MAG: hypothetical protein HY079_08425 [Elusimicrobia bacterium]|nr:hypothetical protein [Elusimicrobiota bacterium]
MPPALALVASVCLSSAPSLAPLAADPRLAGVVAAHPGAALDAAAAAAPEARERPGGGSRFVYALPLLAPTGVELAATTVACDFDGDARFLGARLLTVGAPAAFAVAGEVARGEAFEAPIDSTRTFRLAPFTEGWTIEVTGPGGDFCRPLTPPYRGTNDLELFGWHFRDGDDPAPRKTDAPGPVRRFRCAATEAERAVAEASLGQVLWTEGVPWKKVDEAVSAHERLRAKAERGTLTVRSLRLGNLGPGRRPWIETLRFRFELRPPEPGEP